MIQQAYITAWRAKAPWATDAQVEQDLALSRVLVEIFGDEDLRAQMAFRGGTALHKLFLKDPQRYSEDIDLVQVKAGPIGPAMKALRRRLDPWLGEPQWKQGAGRATFFYRFASEIPPVTPIRLKVEINTREHFQVLGLSSRPFAIENPWFSGSAKVTTYALEELLGTKLRALYQRKKGRDLFDLAAALGDHPEADRGKIVDCFLRYLAHDKLRVSRAQFEGNLEAKLEDPAFLGDIVPLLSNSRASASFDVPVAAREVQTSLIALIPGSAWKRSGRQGKR